MFSQFEGRRKLVVLVSVLCVAYICPQQVYAISPNAASSAMKVLASSSERPVPRERSATGARAAVGTASPILVFGLLGLAIIAAGISFRMICDSSVNDGFFARPDRKVHASEHRVESHYS